MKLRYRTFYFLVTASTKVVMDALHAQHLWMIFWACSQIRSSSNEDYYDDPKPDHVVKAIEAMTLRGPPRLEMVVKMETDSTVEPTIISETEASDKAEAKGSYRRTLSGGLQSPGADVPKKTILERLKSKSDASSYQLGKQLSLKWCTGAGPRIGCVADYPVELRTQALEFVNLSPRNGRQPVNLSPRLPPTPSGFRHLASSLSPNSVCASGN